MKLNRNGKRRIKLSKKLSAAINSDTPLRVLAGNLSRVANHALIEANSVSIEKIEIRLARLPKKLDGFRIVHLSDIHHSPFTSLEFIRHSVEIANSLEPDLFALTGDFVSHEPEYIAPMAELLAELSSEFGSFACLGNHDHWTDAEAVTAHLRAAGIKVLINEGFRFAARDVSFWFGGVDDYMVGKTDLRSALRGAFPDEMILLLAHNPNIMRQASLAGVDLILSGHTHGGQVKIRDDEKRLFPRRRLTNGLRRRRQTQIYITRGIGTVVLPIRYGCPPEISLLELKSA